MYLFKDIQNKNNSYLHEALPSPTKKTLGTLITIVLVFLLTFLIGAGMLFYYIFSYSFFVLLLSVGTFEFIIIYLVKKILKRFKF